MTIGLIDLGSNTIKLAVYRTAEQGFDSVFYDATYAYVYKYIEGEQLNAQGLARIVETLLHYKQVADTQGCDALHCFSTASLRNIQNQAEVLAQIKQKTGIAVTPLSGDEEALYNVRSMRQVIQTPRFVGADLGGGSLQLFCQNGDEEPDCISLPLGALRMYRQFVSDTFPTVNEMFAIKTHVLHALSQSGFCHGTTTLYQTGGTARTIAEMLGRPEGFGLDDLETAITGMISNPALAEKSIEAVNPARRLTLIPGMIVIYAVADYLQVNDIVYLQNSVREGFLSTLFLPTS